MSNVAITWYIIPLIAVIVGYRRTDLRRPMVWAGLLALPVLAIQPLISNGFWPSLTTQQVFVFLLSRGVICFSLAAVAAAFYETFWHHHFTKEDQPSRQSLLWLMIGPVIFLGLKLLHWSFVASLLVSLIIDLIIVLTARKDLIWDMFFSGLMMGLLYGVLFWITSAAIPGDLANFGWFGPPYGLNVFGLPIEEVIIIILFGILWGPIYVAIKDLRTN